MMKKFKIITLLSLGAVTLNINALPLRKAGDYVQLSVPVVALASTLWQQDKAGLEQLALSLYSTQVFVYTYKHIFPVQRLLNPNNTQSGISGHTAIPMASSAYLLCRYGWEYAWPSYVLSAFVGYTRVSSKAHRLNEVIGGAILGQVVSYLVTTSCKENVQLSAGFGTISLNINF